MRTIRLVSGASLIFSAPKFQWVQVLERLHISVEGSDDKLSEIIVSHWKYSINLLKT